MRLKNMPEILVILGSGWGKVIDNIEIRGEIAYGEWLGVKSSVKGHAGKLVISKDVVFMNGRLHLYEGFSASQVVEPIKKLASAGVKKMIVTSAVGALNDDYRVGDVVVLKDLLTLFLPESPLKGGQFQDMSEVFDQKLRVEAGSVMKKEKIRFHAGVYAYMPGPQFETFADKAALKTLGADVVGMSTAAEVIMAKSLGLRVLGLSLVTNLAFVSHSHKQVLATAEKSSQKLANILQKLI